MELVGRDDALAGRGEGRFALVRGEARIRNRARFVRDLGHVFDELDGAERISAEQAIRKARAEMRDRGCDLHRIALPAERTKPTDWGAFARAL